MPHPRTSCPATAYRRAHAALKLAGTAAVLLCTAASSAMALRLQAVLSDPDFPAPGPYRVELLETGDTLSVTPGVPFSMQLPRDTVWTLCYRTGAGAQGLEKCEEVRGARGDSVVSARLGGAASFTVAEPAPEQEDVAIADAAGEAPATIAGGDGDAVRLQRVVLRAQRTPKRAMGRETVSAKLIKRMPGLAEADVIRSIQGLPGVVSSSDFSTKIYVRGGGSDQNLILFDNAPVFSPTHFFGLFSTFLVEGVDDVTFYKGGFAPEYGNRLSSVLDIRSRKGGSDTADSWLRGSSLKISTISTQAHTEGRQGNARWLFAGRTTYIKELVDFLRNQGLTTLTLDYYFYDVQGSFAYGLGEGRELMFSLYQGRDILNFDPFLVEWGNTVVPLNLAWRVSNVLDTRTTLSYSLLSQSFGLEDIFELYNNIVTWQARHVATYTGIDKHRLSLGGSIERSGVVFRNTQDIAGFSERDDSDFWLVGAFLQDTWTPDTERGRVWELSPGLRLNYLSTLNTVTAEPRFSAKRRFPHDQSVDLHVGRYVQHINSILFSDQENLNEFYYPAQHAKYRDVEPSSSWLFAAGYSRDRIFNEFTFSLEAYYKTLHDLLVNASSGDIPDSIRNDPEIRFGDTFKTAEGYSYGYEVTLRRPEGTVSGGISYSSGTSVVREQYYDQAYYPKWHQPHSFKLDATINWTGSDGIWPSRRKGRYFRSSTQVKYATGLPYTEVVGYQPSRLIDQNQDQAAAGPSPVFPDNLETVNGSYNLSYVPSYFRWDVKPVDIGREGKWNFAFTILNVTNHENIFFYSYDRQKNPPERISVTQFPLFPFLLSYEYYF